MSGVSPWLRAQRKHELVDLADEAGLKGYEHLKKVELEIALDNYLRENETSLSSHSRFNPFYARAGSTASPVKRDSVESWSAAPVWEGEAKGIKSRSRRLTKAVDEVGSTIVAATTRTPRQSISLAHSAPLPPSPAVIADVIDSSTAELRSRFDDLWEAAGITERAENLRESLSSVVTIEAMALAMEALGLRSKVLPLRYAFTIPAIAGLRSSGWPVSLPDLFLLLTSSFWSPVLLWASTSFFVPLLFAYFFNLTLKAKSTQSGIRPQHSVQPTYQFDPLAFNVVKALATYLVYSQGATFGGVIGQDSIDTVRASVPGGAGGILIGAAIGGLTSIYEAILRK